MDAQSKRRRFRSGQVRFAAGKPFDLIPTKAAVKFTAQERLFVRHIATFTKAYLRAGHELLKAKYSDVTDLVPSFLVGPTRALVACSKNGVIIRYEHLDGPPEESDEVYAAYAVDSVEELLPKISEAAVFWRDKDGKVLFLDENSGVKILLGVRGADGTTENFAENRIMLSLSIPDGSSETPIPPGKPFRLAGIQSTFEIQMLAQEVEEGSPAGDGRFFLMRAPLKLPLGWDYIEVFPQTEPKQFNKDFANSWAEFDILTWVMQKKLREDRFRALDPNLDVRREMAELLAEYETLLNSQPKEEDLQSFLKSHPALLCPTHSRVWPKVPFGDKVSDFVFKEPGAGYLLVELELPSARLFTKNGDTSAELKHAQNQVLDWTRYIQDNLKTVQDELGLVGMTSDPPCLLVMGRSAAITKDERRKLAAIESHMPRLKIMTFDDVLVNARAAIEHIVGPLSIQTGSAQIYYLPAGSDPVPVLQSLGLG